jgi:excisionase family DNA binding protein
MKRNAGLAPLDERQRYTVDESLEYLRVSRARLYKKIQAGELTVLKDGRRTFIPGSEIARLSRFAAA